MPDTLEEQLTKYLTDVHSIEVQALLQLRVAPRMARDPELARAFREHVVETEEQERRVRERLEAHAADPSRPQILLIGDSIVYGMGLKDDETMSAELQRLRPGHRVLNGAVSGSPAVRFAE